MKPNDIFNIDKLMTESTQTVNEVNPHNYDSDEDYYNALKAPAKRRSAPSDYPYSQEDDDAYFREIWRKNREAKAKQDKDQGVAEGYDDEEHKTQGEEHNVRRVDMTGKECEECHKGDYQETGVQDDMHGVLHCTNCGKQTDRWKMYRGKGVAEGSESEADIDKKIAFHQQGQAAAQYKGSMNKMHAKKIRDLEASKKSMGLHASLEQHADDKMKELGHKFKGVAEAAKWRDPKYQGKTFDYDDSYEGPGDKRAHKLPLTRTGARDAAGAANMQDPLAMKQWIKKDTGKITPDDIRYTTDKDFGKNWYNQPDKVAEGHADQQRKIVKQNGKPVGEVGIDRESSPGNGQWYMKCYANGIDNSGYDSMEEALAELKHCLKQGVAEETTNNPEYSDEVGYVKDNLHTIVRIAKMLNNTMVKDENLPDWVQEKVAQAKGMLVASADYLKSQHEQGHVYTNSDTEMAESPDYAAMYESQLNEFSSAGGTGGIATSMSVGSPKAGTLFGGSYSQKNGPFKKNKPKKSGMIKR
jgi:hypothetical protein